jgi:hypothetical protein
MSSTTDRIALCEEILALIERKRLETGDESLGERIERVVIDTQFREVEREVLEDPGAIAPWLIRHRRGEA